MTSASLPSAPFTGGSSTSSACSTSEAVRAIAAGRSIGDTLFIKATGSLATNDSGKAAVTFHADNTLGDIAHGDLSAILAIVAVLPRLAGRWVGAAAKARIWYQVSRGAQRRAAPCSVSVRCRGVAALRLVWHMPAVQSGRAGYGVTSERQAA